jgi:CRP-like cAMP-binding protein
MTDTVTPETLKTLPIFSQLSKKSLEALVGYVHIETFASDELIFAEQQQGDRFYVILDGAVKVSRHISGVGEEPIAVHRRGAYFGELSVLDDSPRSTDARATEATSTLSLRKADLEELMFQDSAFAQEMLWVFTRHLAVRLRETNEKLRALHQMHL